MVGASAGKGNQFRARFGSASCAGLRGDREPRSHDSAGSEPPHTSVPVQPACLPLTLLLPLVQLLSASTPTLSRSIRLLSGSTTYRRTTALLAPSSIIAVLQSSFPMICSRSVGSGNSVDPLLDRLDPALEPPTPSRLWPPLARQSRCLAATVLLSSSFLPKHARSSLLCACSP